MTDALQRLHEQEIDYLLCGYSALDRYFRLREPGPLYLATDSSVVSLVKTFDNLQFTGLPMEDAVVQEGTDRLVFRCVDSLSIPPSSPFTVLQLLYDPGRKVFLDRGDIYPDLRVEGLSSMPDSNPRWVGLCEASRLVSRYHYSVDPLSLGWARGNELPPASYQRDLLACLLTSRSPEKGLRLLESAGFVTDAWPELAAMAEIPHGKDYHPEGNVWEHTLETLKYRKRFDLTLSLALLLHDSGKPAAENTGEKRFDGHSELGARVASRFLRRLGFPEQMVEAVEFLVRYHMMPPALKSLPPFRTERVLASPLFPTLLELYRADLSSAYADEEGYYEACRVYRAWQKDRGNPYIEQKRSAQRAAAARRR